MITFSTFQSLGEKEKLEVLLEYIDTYDMSEIAAHWHLETNEIFDIQMNLIRKKEEQDKDQLIRLESIFPEKKDQMLTYDQIQALPPLDKAKILMRYHEAYDGKTGLLADALGIETKKMYNLIYQSRQKLRESKEKRVDGNMTASDNHDQHDSDNLEKIDQLYLSTNMIEDDMTVELNGEGSSDRVARLLKSVAVMLDGTYDTLTIELKIKRPE